MASLTPCGHCRRCCWLAHAHRDTLHRALPSRQTKQADPQPAAKRARTTYPDGVDLLTPQPASACEHHADGEPQGGQEGRQEGQQQGEQGVASGSPPGPAASKGGPLTLVAAWAERHGLSWPGEVLLCCSQEEEEGLRGRLGLVAGEAAPEVLSYGVAGEEVRPVGTKAEGHCGAVTMRQDWQQLWTGWCTCWGRRLRGRAYSDSCGTPAPVVCGLGGCLWIGQRATLDFPTSDSIQWLQVDQWTRLRLTLAHINLRRAEQQHHPQQQQQQHEQGEHKGQARCGAAAGAGGPPPLVVVGYVMKASRERDLAQCGLLSLVPQVGV